MEKSQVFVPIVNVNLYLGEDGARVENDPLSIRCCAAGGYRQSRGAHNGERSNGL